MTSVDTIMSRSPGGHSIDASEGGNVNVTRLEVGPKITVLLLALSIMVNGACFWEIFTNEREARLSTYTMENMKAEQLAPIKAQVDALEKRIDTLQMQMAIKQEITRK